MLASKKSRVNPEIATTATTSWSNHGSCDSFARKMSSTAPRKLNDRTVYARSWGRGALDQLRVVGLPGWDGGRLKSRCSLANQADNTVTMAASPVCSDV